MNGEEYLLCFLNPKMALGNAAGFDEPRLDTLFIAMPIAFSRTHKPVDWSIEQWQVALRREVGL